MKGWPPRFCAACGARVARVRGGAREQRRCPRCGFTFYANPVPAVVAIIARGNRILLTRRANPPWAGTWDLPGGFVEGDETALSAIERELVEELGVRTRRARLHAIVSDRYGRGGFPVLTLVYRVTPAPGRIAPADDVSDARWFTRETIPYRAIAFPSMRRALRDWAARTPTASR
jgi:8-oxo-dGTP diphosphatase